MRDSRYSQSTISNSSISSHKTETRYVRRTFVERCRVAPSPEAQYRYELDDWEKLPSTDFTYAKSFTYDRYSPSKTVEYPNMARRRVKSSQRHENITLATDHEGTPLRSRSPSAQRRHSNKRSAGASSVAETTRESNKERHYSSATRSGCQYSSKRTGGGKTRASSVRRSESWTEDERESREMKRREYAGLSTGYKESSSRHQQYYDEADNSSLHRVHLYGLDDGDCYSDAAGDDDSVADHSTDSASMSYRPPLPQSSSFLLFKRRVCFLASVLHRYGSLMSRALWQGICFIVLSPYYLLMFTANYLGAVLNATSASSEHHSSVDSVDVVDGSSSRNGEQTDLNYAQRLMESSSSRTSASSSTTVASSRAETPSTTRMRRTRKRNRQSLHNMRTRSGRGGAAEDVIVSEYAPDFLDDIDAADDVASYALTAQTHYAQTSAVSSRSLSTTSSSSLVQEDRRSRRSFITSFFTTISTVLRVSVSRCANIVIGTPGASYTFVKRVTSSLLYGCAYVTASSWSVVSRLVTSVATSSKTLVTSPVAFTHRMTSWIASAVSTSTGHVTEQTTGFVKLLLFVVVRLLMFVVHLCKALVSVPVMVYRALVNVVRSLRPAHQQVDAASYSTTHETVVTATRQSARLAKRLSYSDVTYDQAASVGAAAATGAVSAGSSAAGGVGGATVAGASTSVASSIGDRMSWIGRRINRFFGRTIVADTAMLRGKNSGGLCVYLPIIILLPLLLSGVYWYKNKMSRKSLWDSDLGLYPKRTVATQLSASEQEIRAVLAAMLQERDEFSGNKQDSIYLELLAHQAKLQKELALLAAQVKSQGEEENRQFAVYSSHQDTQATQISSVNDRLLKLEVLIKELQSGHESLKMQGDLDRRHAESDVAGLRAEMRRAGEEKQADLMLLFRQLESTVSGKESELRNLFVDIVRTELSSYDNKDELNARLADITAKISQLGAQNNDIRNKIELQKEYSDARVTNVMDDSNSLSVKIDKWNLKLEQLRAEFETKLSTSNDAQTTNAYSTNADIGQLQQVIEQLHADIEGLKETASRTRTAAKSRDDEISQLRADMVYQQELDDVREHIDTVCTGVISGAHSSGFGGDLSGLSNGQIEGMIAKALATYHADRTGKTDYALESAGGSVVSIRCSETYSVKTAQLSIWGIPLWYTSSSPRSIIQPDVYPGQCWAMSGSTGYVVISLAATINVHEFSLEHIPKSLAPDGDIKSAPREFSVWGLQHLKDYPGENFGNYTYRESGNPIQYFKAQSNREKTFDLVELRVHSNWGDSRYTCLYRFRVHGKLPSKYSRHPES